MRARRGKIPPYAVAVARVAKHTATCTRCEDALLRSRGAPAEGWCRVGRRLVDAALAHAPAPVPA